MFTGTLSVEKYSETEFAVLRDACNLHVVDGLERRSRECGRHGGTRTNRRKLHSVAVSDPFERNESYPVGEKLIREARGVALYEDAARGLSLDVAQKSSTYCVAEPNPS